MTKRDSQLTDLAREVGVSVSTVSRALRGLRGVKADTRVRIERAARRLSYVPNHSARALASGRTNQIGLVMPSYMHLVPESTALARFDALSQADGKRVIHVTYDLEECDTLCRLVRGQRWDGVLIYPTTLKMVNEALPAALKMLRCPVVIFYGPESPLTDTVTFDRPHGVRVILDHARELGVRRVGIVAMKIEADNLPRSEKYGTLAQELAARGMELTFGLGIPGTTYKDYGVSLFTGAYETMRRALSGDPEMPDVFDSDGGQGRRPLRADLLMCANDVIAAGAMNCLLDHGYRVPEDLAVSGYDDNDTAAFTRPPLTSVHRPLDEMAELGWTTLKRRLDGETSPPRLTTLLPRLVPRASTTGFRRKQP